MEQQTYSQLPVRPLTRVVAGALVLILVLAAVGLYGWPGETERLFAWTIKPELTPLLMGAGYASGIVFFLYVARARSWLEVSFGFVGITVFATLMGVATIIHWDRFNHDHPAFIAWVVVYAVAPLLVPALWVYNGGWRRGPVEARLGAAPRRDRACQGGPPHRPRDHVGLCRRYGRRRRPARLAAADDVPQTGSWADRVGAGVVKRRWARKDGIPGSKSR